MKKILSILAISTLVFTSCNKENEKDPEELSGKNNVHLEFDNGIAGKKLKLGETFSSGDEEITVEAFDYIVGNFVLTNDKGEEVKVDGFSIISAGGHNKDANNDVMLPKIPAGKYTKIKFGLGVDPETYKKQTEKYIADGKKTDNIDLWTKAKKYKLVWSWTSGYKFVQYEGKFSSKENTEKQGFKVHIASKGSANLYKEIELSLKDGAIVSDEVSPQVHIMVDAFKILKGENTIKLSEGGIIMGGEKAVKIARNTTKMFMVHHIHNDGSHH